MGELANITSGKSVISNQSHGAYAVLGSRGIIGHDDSYDYQGSFILIARVGAHAGHMYHYVGKVKISDNTIFLTSQMISFLYCRLLAFNLKQLSFGTGQPLIKANELKSLLLTVPPTSSEQERIVGFFCVLDDLIAAAKKKADLLKLKKRYYLQAIFSQQLRFKGFTEPWQQRKLGELLSVRKETTTTPTLYHIDIELENLQEDGGLVGDATVRTNSTSVFRRGDVLFGRLRPYLRKWWLATESGIRSGEIWAIYSPSRVLISSFVYALVQSPIFLQVALITSGTKMPRSDWENIASEAGSLPCSNDEQARIGDFFNKLDNLIAASCRKIELLERCKDAYLQLLFI